MNQVSNKNKFVNYGAQESVRFIGRGLPRESKLCPDV